LDIKASGENLKADYPNLDYIKNNGTDGVMDLHFSGSMTHAEGTVTSKVDTFHAQAIKEACKATQYLGTTLLGADAIYTEKGMYLPMTGKSTMITQYWSSGHAGIDFQDRNHVDKETFMSDGVTYTQDVKPTVPIYAMYEGKVIAVKCHNPKATGNSLVLKEPDPDVMHLSQSSDHSIKTINKITNGHTYYADIAEGDCVYVQSDNGDIWYYMHMYCGSVQVMPGDYVKGGQVLGYEGNTGDTWGTTGIHLHLQYGQQKSVNINWIAKLVLSLKGN
jgi:murein DD-endopeptidase MepM/ murein hydrolase activator NlpD